MRRFNTTGLCVPEKHYMVDISGKIAQIRVMVDRGDYFTINRARQYGKTTALFALQKSLFDAYICVSMSFEGLGDSPFESQEAFCVTFMDLVQSALQWSSAAENADYIADWVDPSVTNFKLLSKHIDRMCRDRKIVLVIDEVDKTSNNRVYIHFLGMLRDKYLARERGQDHTFQSVILAGVYDIKNIKLKLINEGIYSPSATEGKLYNSPWNIAADFKVDMSFSPSDIATMLNEYEGDCHTGMDIPAISQEIYTFTMGYPFLVSRTCKLIDEDFDKDWTHEGVQRAVKYLIGRERNTLFDDIFKNLEAYPDLYEMIYDLLIVGNEEKYSPDDPVVNWALMFGFVRQEGEKIVIANRIFEIRITNYFISKDYRRKDRKEVNGVLKYDVVKDGRFDMELCLTRFAQHYRKIFTEKDASFLERHGRLVFLSFLTPLINGEGFYYIESETTDARRMDLVVSYGKQEFIIELKIWRGEEYRKSGYRQLADYLNSRGAKEGYLLTFDCRKESNKKPGEEWINVDELRVFDVML
jgi:hypothetical protein